MVFSQRISYRANWFNLMIYGNGVHVIGYMMISAWISSILEKFAGRKDNNHVNAGLEGGGPRPSNK